jgi:hypothetical protein
MSSITSTSEVNELLEDYATTLKDLGAMQKRFAKLLGGRRRRVTKDPDAEPGESRSAWQEWAKTCAGRFEKDYAAHLEEVGKKADVMTFASKCRAKTHIEEWNTHEAEWLEAHPKPEAKPAASKKKAAKGGAKAAIVGSEDEAAMEAKPAKKAGKKPAKKAEEASSDEEEKPAKKAAAKKAAKKAEEGSGDEAPSKKPKKAEEASSSADEGGSTASKKSKKKAPVADEALPEASPAPEAKKRLTKAEKEATAAAAAAASEAAAKANPPTPCKYRGKDYLKNDLNQVWQVGEDGAVGAWHGILSEDGKKMEKTDGPI